MKKIKNGIKAGRRTTNTQSLASNLWAALDGCIITGYLCGGRGGGKGDGRGGGRGGREGGGGK